MDFSQKFDFFMEKTIIFKFVCIYFLFIMSERNLIRILRGDT